MREILFRGKRIDNGEWVEGLLTMMWSQYHIINPNDENTAYPVDPETVGQYTGLTDKNGMKIFEGDVISLITADYEPITIVCKFGKVERQIFESTVEITGFYFIRSNDGRKTFPIVKNYLGKHDVELYEVIDNVHDMEANTNA